MSIVNLPNLEKYWSRSPLYDASVVDKVMPIIRFKALLSFLQINCDPDKDDKLTRIGLLLDHVQNVSQSMYHPYEAVSVDERMVSSKHQYSGIRQFIRDKPIRFGIKLWVLADALSGYTYAFYYVYLGKKRTVICQKSKGLAYNVVMELGKNIFQQGYRIYTDSFYTTQHLADDLLTKRTFLIGAVRRTSSAMPKQFKDIEQFEKCSARGDFRWHRANCFAYVQWRDCKTVTVISPIHRGSDVSYCHRTVNERKGFKKKKVVQPSVIHDYNTNMGGVDKSNQMLNKYPCYIKSKFHWWKVIFFHCITIMIVNSFIILTEFNQKTSNKVENISNQLEYREALALSLMDIHSSDETEKQTCMPACLDKRIDCSYCNAKASLKGNKTPSTKTNIYCSKCEVPLCLRKDRNCFTKWHSVGGEEAKHEATILIKEYSFSLEEDQNKEEGKKEELEENKNEENDGKPLEENKNKNQVMRFCIGDHIKVTNGYDIDDTGEWGQCFRRKSSSWALDEIVFHNGKDIIKTLQPADLVQ
ncbi:Hypothetical predicted protein [Mytilus galloprovincialis]|uniref:PiggyBac transposable element-derived protein domain-containing protein n=1 Tax=Mytilus galloprovincialis TaxID=29158 RepID=A0A8B6GVX5_MYTGA|nr:Hypothetical predicted protein [Mytilus galloprovincialis]